MRAALLVLMLCLPVAHARAIDVPEGSTFDKRIQYVDYNAGDVVALRAAPGIGVRIVFSPGETILDIASGFTQGWELSDRRNILYVKPKSLKGDNGQAPMTPEAGRWNTNLMVTTNLRMYDFDLILAQPARRGARTPQAAAYRVEFRYPGDEAAKTRQAAAQRDAQARLDAKAAPRNWNYTLQAGSYAEGIVPTMAYDDGRFTYLRFPNNRDFPSVFLVAADQTESLVNTHVEDDVLVVQRVAPRLVLRLGRAVVGLYNESFDADGLPPAGGTTVPGVRRTISSKERKREQP